MAPRVDAPVVSISYADEMTIEVVPAFVNKMVLARSVAPGVECYLIATGTGKWIPADYDYDALYITSANATADSYLVPASKLIKTFVRNQNLGIKSFHIEVLCSLIVPSLISDWRTKGYRWTHQHVFAHTLSRIAHQFGAPVAIPGSYSLPVSSGLDPLSEALAKAILAEKAKVALTLTEPSGRSGAVEAWRNLFGSPFATA
jgi:hypothetical protein